MTSHTSVLRLALGRGCILLIFGKISKETLKVAALVPKAFLEEQSVFTEFQRKMAHGANCVQCCKM